MGQPQSRPALAAVHAWSELKSVAQAPDATRAESGTCTPPCVLAACSSVPFCRSIYGASLWRNSNLMRHATMPHCT